MLIDLKLVLYEVMVVGKDDSALRASPFGPLPLATLSRCARIEP
ncbi:hypothetical protein SEEA9518_21430 [Salmonella enterica subsp. enterica serovar Agona str. 400095 18]|nr:hypothetical protein SEEA9518_21430 [Salmonella enterica subsp. enterica serovar Agona str. 400095 18]